MTEAERERAAIVEWLRGEPLGFLARRATVRERLAAAWSLLFYGEGAIRSLFYIASLKVERLDHHKENTDNGRD